MGRKVRVEIEKLEDGYYAKLHLKRLENCEVCSDTLLGTLKKVVVRVGEAYSEQIFVKEVFDEE